MTSPRLLLLTASTGNGHLSANKALEAAARHAGLEATGADVMFHCHHVFRWWFAGGYERTVRASPNLWGHLYKKSDRPYLYYQVQTFLDHNFCGGIRHLIESSRPDFVICTHSVAQPRLADFRREYGFKMVVVVTDIHPHRMWLRGKPDFFFAPTEETLNRLEARNPGFAKKCEVVGMPINQAFVDAAQNRRPRGDRPRVLVTAGGIGGGPLLDVAEALEKLDVEADVVAGRNPGNEAKLREAYANHPRIRIYGHIPQDQMADLMANADMMIAKPGGLTTFESLVCGVPFVIFEPLLIPGQEEDNSRYLQRIGAGKSCAELSDLLTTVKELVRSPEERAQMRAAALAYAKPNAAHDIIRRVREMAS